MKTYRIKLVPKGPWITPFHADTMFGHLCWAKRWEKNEDALNVFLQPFRDGNPTFLLSDGFIDDNLPFPLVDPGVTTDLTENCPDDGTEITGLRDMCKKFLKLPNLGYAEFIELIGSENPGKTLHELFAVFRAKEKKKKEEKKKEQPATKDTVTMKNSIDRRTFTTSQEGGGLYHLSETFIKSDSYISVYLRAEEEDIAWILELFRFVGEQGYGKKHTTGRGAFEIDDGPELIDDLDYSGGPFVTLSPFIPEKGQIDVRRSRYNLRLKTGRLGEEFSKQGMPFAKNPLLFFAPGSVMRPLNSGTTFGRVMKNIVPHGEGVLEKVVQYAYAFPVGVRSL